MVREGIASGELIDTDWMQIQLASLGANVFYFLSAPVLRATLGDDQLTYEAISQRRRILVEFLGQAIFVNRQRGAELAAKVFADTPMPEVTLPDSAAGKNLAARVLADAPRPEIWNDEAKNDEAKNDESKGRTK
jgi:hypothetical protein